MSYKIGFYSHIPIAIRDSKLFIPSYMGLFIDGLASYSNKLFLIAHVGEFDNLIHDYELVSESIEVFDLSKKTSNFSRFFFGNRILKPFKERYKEIDHLIVRAPTPLARSFGKVITNKKLHYLLVGDEMDGARSIKINSFKKLLIKAFLYHSDRVLTKCIRGTSSFVNSPALKNRYDTMGIKTEIISTTILSDKSLHYREDSCTSKTINLLYSGRIEVGKGLLDVLYALKMYDGEHHKVVLNIVGWEEVGNEHTIMLKNLAIELGIEDQLVFHGKKMIGDELNYYYRTSDIFIMPSYHEGFPRTIWEAMGNSLPIIATKVGSIPYLLSNNENALLISPKDPKQIAEAINEISSNSGLRKKVIKNAYQLAKDYTMESQLPKVFAELAKA
jgi:glycosyltransferase involved in cell wall biosynthesis